MRTWAIDDDGYPTEETLAAIRALGDAPAAGWGTRVEKWLVEDLPAMVEAMGFGWARVATILARDRSGKSCHEITISTGGWSGIEDVIDAIPPVVDAWYWYESRRGGRHVYRVPVREEG